MLISEIGQTLDHIGDLKIDKANHSKHKNRKHEENQGKGKIDQ